MAKSWASKREFKKLSGELAILEREDFQSRVLPMLRAIWPDALTVPSSRSFDRSGVDHLVWSDGGLLPLVVQCKGFEAKTQTLGYPQIQQCLKSIRTFAESGLRAETYVLVHNRDGRDEQFRKAVEKALASLKQNNHAHTAILLDRQQLLKLAFDAMFQRLVETLENCNLSIVEVATYAHYFTFNPLERVPLQVSTLIADQYHLHSSVPEEPGVADPAEKLFAPSETNLSMLIGEFGFGKTTAVMRALPRHSGRILYVPAAIISEEVNGTKEFLLHCLDLERLLAVFSEEDLPTLELLARPGFEYLLKDSESPITLVLDALDESAFLSRRGSFQHLFNILYTVQVPVILTMRTEFWQNRRSEFETSVGLTARHIWHRRNRIRVIELLAWSNEEIRLLIQRYYQAETEAVKRGRLHQLETLIGSDEFDQLYGDIP